MFGFRLHVRLVLATAPLIFVVAAGSAEAQQPPSSPTNLAVRLTIPGSDTTPPVISSVTASATTSSAATITWTTDESSDSRVDYGPTIYSSASPVNASLVTTHTVTLSGLSQATLYHCRMRSRDAAGNLAISGDFTFTTGGSSQLSLAPEDTSINLNATNYSTGTELSTYTWPDFRMANAILMMFDLSGVPAGAIVQQATLQLALVQSDSAVEQTYVITAHKVVGKNPVIAAATGYTADGVTAWTANTCCSGSVPLAQADISLPYDTQAIDKVPGSKSWTVTTMVQEWLANPASNGGLLLNSDTSKTADHYRYFASMENSNAALRPLLSITYTTGPPDTTLPTVSVTAPAGGATVSGTVTVSANASDNVGVVGVQFRLDGAALGLEDMASPYSVSWNTATASTGTHTLTAVARDAAGNSKTSASVTVTVPADATPPVISAVVAASITSSGATIAWTTNETSNSQVEYGATTGYGSTTTINVSLLTSHQVTLGSLSANTLYHFRVRSRDAALNLAVSGDFTLTTLASAPSGWPHQPPGLTVWTDQPMNALTGSGWNINNAPGYATIVSDAAAPSSPSNVGQWRYPVGWNGGEAPATMYHPLPPSFTEGFIGVSWKPSNPWQGHNSFVNKIYFLLGGACGNLIPVMYGPPGGPYQLRVAPEWGNWNWLTPNVNNISVVLGAWHTIELYFKYNTGPANGIVRWWMDGTLMGDYTNVSFPSSGCFGEFQFSPTWGGVGDVKTQNDFFWFDHAYISYPNGALSDTTPPTVSMTAPSQGATLSGTATTVTATASDNVGVAGVQFKLDGAGLGAEDTSAPYSISWDTTTATDGTHALTAVARDAAGSQTTSAARSITTSNGIPPGGTILFQEAFEDANLAGRGWYDNPTPLLSTAEHVTGSVSSIQYKFNAGATSPTAGAAVRRKFTPTDSVYLGYYVKYSTNWVGSQRTYHPHEFHFLTNLEGDWSGLSFDHLTAYVEQNAGTPLVAIQDGSNVDQTSIGLNLTNVTENRGVAGCNGSSDGYPDNCYSNGTAYVNEKKWKAATQYFTDSPGPFYKNDWHFVEAYIKLNTFSGGKGVNDGIIQYWFDGQPVIDRRDVLLRTGANPSMQFNQFIIAPYIGDGSPVTQSMWIDNLTVSTGRP